MKKVFVNGYGSIGSRITSFLRDDPEITVIGVGKYSPDEKVNVAISRGLNVYVPERKLDDFSNYKILAMAWLPGTLYCLVGSISMSSLIIVSLTLRGWDN